MDLTGLPTGHNGSAHINRVIPSEGTPVNAVASQGELTVDTQPTATDTMTIGTKVYTFTADGTAAADGEIDVGANLAGAQANIIAAINGTDTINDASTDVVCGAFAADVATLTAIVAGVVGDDIATTETFTAATNVFDAATLGTATAGVDGTVGISNDCLMDASYIYYCTATNSIADANWVRTAVASF